MNNESKNQSDIELDMENDDDEIKKLQRALKENEEKFIEAQSIANFGFWEIDRITMKTTWTEGVFNLLGLEATEAELSYFFIQDLIHPEDRDLYYEAKERIIITGKDEEFNLRVIRSDSSMRYLHIIAKPKKDKNGDFVGIKGTAQDITDIIILNNKLHESEIFYKTLLENTGTASIILDENTNIITCNTQFEILSGYSKEELEGNQWWRNIVSKEDFEKIEKYHDLRKEGSENPPDSYEIELIDKKGNIKIILLIVAIIPETKKSVVSLLDLTERKKIERELAESERRYRYIVENATAGMFILDKNGLIKYANDHMAKMLNYTAHEILEMNIKYFIEESENFYRADKQSENNIKRYNWFKFLKKEGDVFWSNLNVSPIFNSKKEFTGCLGIVTDINIQKGLEESFLEREGIFTDIIYDMMEMLNNIANNKNKSEFNENNRSVKNDLDNN